MFGLFCCTGDCGKKIRDDGESPDLAATLIYQEEHRREGSPLKSKLPPIESIEEHMCAELAPPPADELPPPPADTKVEDEDSKKVVSKARAGKKKAASKASRPTAAPPAAAPVDNDAEAKRLQEKAEGELKRQEWEVAILTFSALLELRKDAAAWTGRGHARLRSSMLQEALADLDEALRLDPSFLAALFDRGDVKLELGDFVGSIADFDKYLSMAPGDGRALFQRATAKQRKGDQAEAERDFKFAKRLGHARPMSASRGGA